jgi:cysteine-rich repeat protein
MRTLHDVPRLAISAALLAAVWSCHGDVPTPMPAPTISQADTVCTGVVDDPDPDCRRSLCHTGPSGYCTIGQVEAQCQITVCHYLPACCQGWWTEDCVAKVHQLCTDLGCGAGSCGDGLVDDDEGCDDGNTDDHDGCSAGCAVEADDRCGDGFVDEDEECDAGEQDGSYGSLCAADCKSGGPRCGDGIVQPEEQCDGGAVTYGSGDTGTPLDGPVRAAFVGADGQATAAFIGIGSGTGSGSGSDGPPVCAETCRWRGCGDLVCDEGEEISCPGDCNLDDDAGGDGPGCCESADDACSQRGDGVCQSGCAWGHDPDCDPQPPTDDAQCCGDPSDPCGWNGNGVCDTGCAWVDVDCEVDHCGD